MGKNDGLIIAGVIGAVLLFSAEDSEGQPLISFGDLLSGGDLPSNDFPSIGGDGFNSFLSGIGSFFGSIGDGFGQFPSIDVPSLTGGTPNITLPEFDAGRKVNPSGGDFWNTPIVTPTGNVFTDIGNSLSQTAMSLAKAGVAGLGIYAGSKIAVPVLQTVAPPVARSLTSPVSQIAGDVGKTVSSGTKVVANVATNVSKVATSPVSRVAASPLGKVGVVGAAVTAGAVGYAAGSWFNTTAAGQALIEKSGQAGAAFARSSIGQKVYGVAQLDTAKTDSAFSKIGLTTSQVQTLLKQGYTPQQIVTGAYKR